MEIYSLRETLDYVQHKKHYYTTIESQTLIETIYISFRARAKLKTQTSIRHNKIQNTKNDNGDEAICILSEFTLIYENMRKNASQVLPISCYLLSVQSIFE